MMSDAPKDMAQGLGLGLRAFMLQPVSYCASHIYIYMYLYRLRDEGKRRSGRLWLRLVLEGMRMDWIGCVLGDWRVMRSETPVDPIGLHYTYSFGGEGVCIGVLRWEVC